MKKMTKHKSENDFIEETGLVLESFGLGRMAGRILGWLLICDPEMQSSTQLAHRLQASKGSISTMTRTLVQFGFIKRVSMPGDRSTYFSFTTTAWPNIFAKKIAAMMKMKMLASHGLEIIGPATGERRRRLELMKDFYEFMEVELPKVFTKWEDRKEGTR